MNGTGTPETNLDDLCELALAGDRRAESQLFDWLRVRFLGIAKRRVREDDVEDVVQDALRVVHARYGSRPFRGGMLPWSFSVLRNVIGNHYRQQSRRRRRERPVEDLPPTDLAAGEADADGGDGTGEITERLAIALDRLARSHPRCALLFRRILESLDEGGGPREVSQRAMERVRDDLPDMTAGAFYVTLHRCRARLRGLLRELELEGNET